MTKRTSATRPPPDKWIAGYLRSSPGATVAQAVAHWREQERLEAQYKRQRRGRRNPIGAALVSAARAILHAPRARSAIHAISAAAGARGKRRNPPKRGEMATPMTGPFAGQRGVGICTRCGREFVPFHTDTGKGRTDRCYAKQGKLRQLGAGSCPATAAGRRDRGRHNPATMHAPGGSERLRDMSKSFHGRDDEIVHLGPDQRRVPPERVVLIGVEEEITYRTHRHSERGGDDWTHAAGDTGGGKRRSGRRLIVADKHGRVYNVPGTSKQRFDPKRGLVG